MNDGVVLKFYTAEIFTLKNCLRGDNICSILLDMDLESTSCLKQL